MHFVVTGPESSGKSTLTIALSRYLKQNYIPEYARHYLTYIQTDPYSLEDILTISDQTFLLQKSSSLPLHYIMDTGYLVQKIWSKLRFGQVPKKIEERFIKDQAHYLLCAPEMEWTPDPLRENPSDRAALFDLYLKTLQEYNCSYSIINGSRYVRLNKSLEIIRTYDNSL